MFQNPFFLYLLPLSLLPIAWHLWRQRSRNRFTIPSLFFFYKLYTSKLQRLAVSDLFRLIIEILFIMSLIFAFAGPGRQKREIKKVTLFIDTSPSVYSPAGRQQIKQKILADTSSLLKSKQRPEIYLIDPSRMETRFSPTAVSTQRDVEQFLDGLTLFNRSFDFSMLKTWAKEYFHITWAKDALLFIYSDFRENHFTPEKTFGEEALGLIKINTKKPIRIAAPQILRRFAFSGEPISVRFLLSGTDTIGAGETLIFKLSGLAGDLFVKKLSAGEKTVTAVFPIAAKAGTEKRSREAGIAAVKAEIIRQGSDGSRVEDLLYYSVSPIRKKRIGIDTNGRAFRALFAKDIQDGNIILDNAQTAKNDFLILSGSEWIKSPQSYADSRGILFLPGSGSSAKIEQAVKILTGEEIKAGGIEEAVYAADAMKPGRIDASAEMFEVFERYAGWRDLRFPRYARISSGFAKPLLYYENRMPMAMQLGDWILFTFSITENIDGFFSKGAALLLIYQSMLSFEGSGNTLYLLDTELEQTPNIPSLFTAAEPMQIERGVFKRGKEIIVINRDPKEFTSAAAEDLSAYFPNGEEVSSLKNHIYGEGSFWGMRETLLLLAFLMLFVLLATEKAKP